MPKPLTAVVDHHVSSAVRGGCRRVPIIEHPSPRSNQRRRMTEDEDSFVSLESNFTQLRVSEDSLEHTLSIPCGPDVDISTRVKIFRQMLQASCFQLNWEKAIQEADKELCVAVIQQMVSKMDAGSRDEILQRSFISRKRRAADCVVGAQQPKKSPTKQHTKHSRVTEWFRDNTQRAPDGGIKVPTAATPAKQSRHCGGYSGVDKNTSSSSVGQLHRVNAAVVEHHNFDARCLVCGKRITTRRRRLYTHKSQKGAFYFIYQCCGKEFSHLGSLSADCKRLKDLLPARKLIEWKFVKSKLGYKWRLNQCRGRDWNRCQHCEAIFLDYTGKNTYHRKSECPYASYAELLD